ncbi:MAG TPA: hypothetical protein VFH29_08540 [Anaerolineales bacterium]|nr:hypothetical protein [Anaerolineales bacterium]
MPAKKAAPKQSQSSDMGMMWAWIYAIGLVLAGLAGAFAANLGGAGTYIWYLLILAAVLLGLFYFDYEDVAQFGLRVLVLIGVQTGLGMVPAAGPYLNGFFNGWVMFLMPVVLAMIVMWVWNKRIAPLF